VFHLNLPFFITQKEAAEERNYPYVLLLCLSRPEKGWLAFILLLSYYNILIPISTTNHHA